MLFTGITVTDAAAALGEDWNFLDERVISRFMAFKPVGHNIFGARAITLDAPPVAREQEARTTKKRLLELVKTRRNFEIGPEGIVQVGRDPMCMHVTCAGTPHRTEFLFGYWHINDRDEIILPLPPAASAQPAHLLIVMGLPKKNETDRIGWYCLECANLLFIRELVTGESGFSKFWQFERAVVSEFNSDEAHHTCKQCGHVNPLGYCAFPNLDTEAERASRMQW
jgi:hypothetical protein